MGSQQNPSENLDREQPGSGILRLPRWLQGTVIFVGAGVMGFVTSLVVRAGMTPDAEPYLNPNHTPTTVAELNIEPTGQAAEFLARSVDRDVANAPARPDGRGSALNEPFPGTGMPGSAVTLQELPGHRVIAKAVVVEHVKTDDQGRPVKPKHQVSVVMSKTDEQNRTRSEVVTSEEYRMTTFMGKDGKLAAMYFYETAPLELEAGCNLSGTLEYDGGKSSMFTDSGLVVQEDRSLKATAVPTLEL